MSAPIVRALIAWFVASLIVVLILQSYCGQEDVQLLSQPITIGPSPTVLGPSGGLPVRGSMMTVHIVIADSRYRRELTKAHGTDTMAYSAIYGRDGAILMLEAALIGPDGKRSAFDPTATAAYGMDSASGIQYILYHPSAGRPRGPLRVEVTASAPARVTEAHWISGNPGAGTWP